MKRSLAALVIAGLLVGGTQVANAAPIEPSLYMTGANILHSQGLIGSGATVAIIDSGVNLDHPFLKGQVVDGFCQIASYLPDTCPDGTKRQLGLAAAAQPLKDGKIDQTQDHGDMVSGIVAGIPNDNAGGGVAPGAKILMARAGGSNDEIMAALDYILAQQERLNIVAVSMSIGSNQPAPGRVSKDCDLNPNNERFLNKFKQLRQAGIVPFAASGNTGAINDSLSTVPACLGPVIAVGSVNTQGKIADYTNMSDQVELLAPDFMKSASTFEYRTSGGTSAATPYAAGAFAVLKQAFPLLSSEQIISAMKKTGDPIDDLVIKGTPLINMPKAYAELSGKASTSVPCTKPTLTLIKYLKTNGKLQGQFKLETTCEGAVSVMANQKLIGDSSLMGAGTHTFDLGASVQEFEILFNGKSIFTQKFMSCTVEIRDVRKAFGYWSTTLSLGCPTYIEARLGSKLVWAGFMNQGTKFLKAKGSNTDRFKIQVMGLQRLG